MITDYSENKFDEVVFWLNDKELQDIPTSEYWNKEEEEKKKEYYICEGGGEKLIKYLNEKTTCYAEYVSAINFANNYGLQVKGIGIDIAAGVCWTTAFLSRIKTVDRIYALDISKHRILKIAPYVLDLLNADTEKVKRIIGSFYDIKLPDKSTDFCFMSQAFHYVNNPERLLSELHRILKPAGVIFITGEKPISS